MKVFFSRKNTSEGKRRASRGFTLTEMLVVIAIIAILVGIAFLAASGLIASMRQNKLDTIAQDIYVAAQDRLTEMYTDNRADAVSYEKLEADGGSTAGMFLLKADDTLHKPKDWDSTIPYAGLNALYNKDAAAAAVLLPKGALSAEVEDNHWIVEYNPEYGYIYGVFYSEKGFDPADISNWYSSNTANKYRVFADRKGSGVGYYGGVGVLGGKVVMTNTSLNVSVNIINAEELKADISVKIPTEFKDRPVRLTMTFTGEQSGVVRERTVVKTYLDGYFNRTYSLVMDSFNKSGGKSQQFGSQDLFDGMFPGENVTMVVDAELGTAGLGTFTPDPALDTARTTAVFNSLFQSVGGTTAYVSAGRHLQNLNNLSQTGLSSVEITNVVQTGNIDFKNTTPDVVDDAIYWWAETYPDRTFEPINNSRIVSVLGSGKDEQNNTVYYIINGMTVEGGTEPSGMFGTLGKIGGIATVTDVSLVGSKVTGSGAVGALAGETKGSVTLNHTGAYLTRDDYNNKTYNTADVALNGDTVGGLVGAVGSDVTATECYAAEVLRGSSYVGGLFGAVNGKMELKSSYADCYLIAKNINSGSVGGLAGACGSTSIIDNCYSAGFTLGVPANSAGFVPGTVASMRNSYTVLNIGPDGSETMQLVQTYFFTTADCGNCTNVYYAPQEGVPYDAGKITYCGEEKVFSLLRNTRAASFTKLHEGSFRFGGASGDTTAYNLAAGLGLTNYPYPFILRTNGTVLHHYGDWDGNLFDSGTLVYFEQYDDGSRGYYGAGSNFLDSGKTVKRDGYALLYTANSVEQAPYYGTKEEATVKYGGTTVTIPTIQSPNGKYTVTKRSISGNPVPTEYYFRDLPGDIVNSKAAATSDFYTLIEVLTPDTKDDENKGDSFYYFNPHFAATVVQVESPADKPSLASAARNVVRIRTPRQLYLLSRDFDNGHSQALTSKITLEQEMRLDYAAYNWSAAELTAVASQTPIGHGGNKFNATYDGRSNQITGVSFLSDNLYTGMFGCVGSEGRLRNIILGAQKDDERYIGFTKAPQQANNYAYVGTLAGYNSGTITNCAAAGYSLSLDTYNTTLYVGGLVGYNNRTVSNCSAENPMIAVRTNSANAFVGSFVGYNSGSGVITSTCSMSSLDVTRYTSGTVRVGGFAGGNAGSIRSSYTAAAMIASNIQEKDIDGFALTGGSVQSCYFLTGGTYKFAGAVYAYGQDSQTANKAVGVENMPGYGRVSLDGFGPVSSEGYCYFNGEVQKANSPLAEEYPFGSPVKLISGGHIFCGDWITDDVFGDYGMLYWEHEVGGTNEGYHFYLVDNTGEDFDTLCTAHDDGGVITEYGYGYYRLGVMRDQVGVPTFHSNVDVQEAYRNEAAERDLSGQFADSYEFVLYNTSGAFKDSPDGLYVTGSNAYATATYGDKKFSFSPFFGATLQMGTDAPEAMEIRSIDQLQFLNWNYAGQQVVTGNEYKGVIGSNKFTFEDLWDDVGSGDSPRATGYYFPDGNDYYQVSVTRNDKDRYSLIISVNGQNKKIAPASGNAKKDDKVNVKLYRSSPIYSTSGGNTKQLVTASNYTTYTYLGRTTIKGSGTQKKYVYGNNNVVFDWEWNQTHDIKLDSSVTTGFTPIAAAGSSSNNSGYNATLYAWFGSIYDGHSYKIEDVNITSGAYTVGLFGVTAGAHMKNIIMYSEHNASIVRSAPYRDDTLGAYSIGGLIGVAYDYANPDDNHAIENCAIAGYKIIDNSENQQGRGEANVGGLVGVSNGDLKRCSAVTDIQINCTHRKGQSGYTQASFGNFIRVGGLTGATLGTVTNCYTGGKITVGAGTLEENVTNSGYNSQTGFATQGRLEVTGENQHSSTSVYLSGIGGSGFAQNYQNFSGKDDYREGAPTYRNCYTYMEFPRLTGTIRSICAIGGLADRYFYGKGVTIDNCYYLEEYLKPSRILPGENDPDRPQFYYNDWVPDVIGTLKAKVNGTEMYYYYQMINGTSVCENKLIKYSDVESKATGTPTSATLGDMPKLSLPAGSWKRVTTVEENGATVNGKYSFPGSDHQLDGQNYPFLATVTQNDDKIFVHYGRWPKGEGLFSDKASITLDLLTENEDSLDVILTNYRDYNISGIASADDLTLSFNELTEDGTIQDVAKSGIVQVTSVLQDDGTVKLTILGLKEGTTTITASYEGYQAKIQVTVTAEFSIEVTPVAVTMNEEGQVTQVTDLDPGKMPEAFQQESLYWKLSAFRYNKGDNTKIPIALTAKDPENWRVEENTIDRNFDDFEFLTAETGEVLLRFWSNAAKVHTVQVTAYNVNGVNGQQVTGIRSREISFLVKQNPPTVQVFAYPQSSEQNTLVHTLYQLKDADGNVGYYRDKDGAMPISVLNRPEEAPAGCSDFLGYFLAANTNGVSKPFAEPDENGVLTIDYFEPIENDEKNLIVFGMWKYAQFKAVFDPGYQDVTVDGIAVDPDTSKYTLVYTMEDSLTIPGVDPTEVEDPEKGGLSVFSGWEAVPEDESTNWTAGKRYSVGAQEEKGKYGNVTFRAVWSSWYEIHYFQANGTEYPDVDESLTTYVGDSETIRLFVPTAPEGDNVQFIGWKLMESENPDTVTGWASDTVYEDPVSGIGFTGNVKLQALWGTKYTITFRNEGAEDVTATYVEGLPYQFPGVPDGPDGYVFTGWSVVNTSEDSALWNVGDLLGADFALEKGHGYKGNVELLAQWDIGHYTISFDLDGGTAADGSTDISDIPYVFGEGTVTLPGAPTKDEFDFGGWIVKTVSKVSDNNSWKVGQVFDAGVTLNIGNEFFGDVELQALWKEPVYRIYYDPAGGIMSITPDPIENAYITKYVKSEGVTLAEATRNGYTLTGWKQTGELAEGSFFGDKIWEAGVLLEGPAETVHMVAQWTENEYTITYLDQDGSKLSEVPYKITDEGTLMSVESIPGYEVKGWRVIKCDDGNWTVDQLYSTDTSVKDHYGDVTMKCIKEPITYNIRYLVQFAEDTSTRRPYDEEKQDSTYTIKDDIPLAAKPGDYLARDGKAYFLSESWKADVGEGSGGWVNGQIYQPGDTLTADAYYGNVNLIAKYVPRTLTLVANGTNYYYPVKDGYVGDSFENYFVGSIPEFETSPIGWYAEIEGRWVKVLETDGSIAKDVDGNTVQDIPGFILNGSLNLTENKTLHAGWKKPVKVFKQVDTLTNNEQFVIGKVLDDGLHVLKATGSDGSYSIETETISNVDGGEYWLEELPSAGSIQWRVRKENNSYSFIIPDTNYYLGRSNFSLSIVEPGWFTPTWYLDEKNNGIYYTVTIPFVASYTAYLTIDSTGATLVQDTPCNLYFFQITDGEVVSYG